VSAEAGPWLQKRQTERGFTVEEWEPLGGGWYRITPEGGTVRFQWCGWDESGARLPRILACASELGPPWWSVIIEGVCKPFELTLPTPGPWRHVAHALNSTLRAGERASLSEPVHEALYLASRVLEVEL
jgi:hypothetical protein